MVSLKEIANIQIGYQARKSIKPDFDSKYKIIQGKDFDEFGNLLINSLMAFQPERKPELYEVKRGNILLQSRGIEHKAFCIEEDIKNIIAAGSFYIIKLKTDNVLPSYLCWWLNQIPVQDYFEAHAAGTLMSFVSKTVVSQLKIKIPSINIQKKIVKTVKKLNQMKNLQNQLQDKYKLLIEILCMNAIHNKEN